MASSMGTFRVVSSGFKVSFTQPVGISGGRTGWMFVVPVPTSPDFPGYRTLVTQAVTAGYAGGRLTERVNLSVAASNALLELPGSFKINLAEMGNECLILADRPTSFQYANFYPTDTSSIISSTMREGADQTFGTASGLSADADSVNNTALPGHTSYLIWFEGLPAAAQNLVDIEYIFHLEGTPTVAASGVNPVPSGPEISDTKLSWTDIMKTVSKSGMSILNVAREYGPAIAKASGLYNTNNAGLGQFRLIGYN
jgi:hypothetical protein